MNLVGISIAGMHDANLMIGKTLVIVVALHLGHVAGNAIRLGHWAGFDGSSCIGRF